MHAMAHRNCLEFSAAREHFMIRKVCSPESSNFLEDRSSPSAYLPVLPPSSRAAKWPLPTSRLTRLTDSGRFGTAANAPCFRSEERRVGKGGGCGLGAVGGA